MHAGRELRAVQVSCPHRPLPGQLRAASMKAGPVGRRAVPELARYQSSEPAYDGTEPKVARPPGPAPGVPAAV